ncbi:MAG: hypothetical protein CVT76_02020 [Alphaproteobacteria bacterium HGW-Alphaproteobacteria-15]|nr:MAG: hypothetical protein CVT76_02020 [Alphaproteobacteria bacterium HGW-Alphaproteobacteria-15]
MPEATKKQLTSTVQARRERAEGLLAVSIAVASCSGGEDTISDSFVLVFRPLDHTEAQREARK